VGALELFGMTHGDGWSIKIVGVLLTWSVVLTLWFGWQHPRLLLVATLMLPIVSLLVSLWWLGEIPTAALRLAACVFGPLWLGNGLGAVALLRAQDNGPAYVVLSLCLAWAADTGGYFAGRALGKHKLYPAVSPKKTVEGAVGGLVATVLAALALRYLMLPEVPVLHMAALGLVGGALGMMGDLGESLLKRSVGVKDSGGFWPGHGGMLDRIDAVLMTGPTVLLYLICVAN